MRWGTIKIISLLRGWGSGHVRVAVTPLGSGFITDEVRLGSRYNHQKVGVTTVGLAPVTRGALGLWIGLYIAARGRSGYPEGSATGSHVTLSYWQPLLLRHWSTITTWVCEYESVGGKGVICSCE